MNDLRREILTQVAAGAISPEEGAARLAALEAEPTGPPTSSPTQQTSPRRVSVSSQLGSAEIVGDPSVAFAVADGPHRVRDEGDTMFIEHVAVEDFGTFIFGRTEGRFFDPRQRRLTVRMNPNLALIVAVQAGSVRVDDVYGPLTVDVQAGNCTVNNFRSTIHLSAQAGNIVASGRLDSGTSRIECEMGSVKLNLDRGSSVRVTAASTMGKVSIEGSGNQKSARGGGRQEVTIGAGAGSLDVDCQMGTVKVYAR